MLTLQSVPTAGIKLYSDTMRIENCDSRWGKGVNENMQNIFFHVRVALWKKMTTRPVM